MDMRRLLRRRLHRRRHLKRNDDRTEDARDHSSGRRFTTIRTIREAEGREDCRARDNWRRT